MNHVGNRGLEADRLLDQVTYLKREQGPDVVHFEYHDFEEEDATRSKLLLIYQNNTMKDILRKHGDYIFLDSTHKTNRYKLPLFQLIVHTPHGYQVVALILTQRTNERTITDALLVIKSWNPDMKPKYCMTDIDLAEVNAILSVFPECQPFYCDFHIKQAWDREIGTLFKIEIILKDKTVLRGDDYDNEKAKKTAFQLLLHLMDADVPYAHHPTETIDSDFIGRLTWVLNHVVVLRNPGFRQYILKWAGVSQNGMTDVRKRWLMAYRNSAGIRGIFTNNGVESLNNVLKNKVMGKAGCRKSIPQLFTALVMDYVPVRQRNYRHKVLADSSCYKRIISNTSDEVSLPKWLNGMPRQSVLKVKVTVSATNVCCECLAFTANPLIPCKHVLAIIRERRISWSSLSPEFRLNAHLTVDGQNEHENVSVVEPESPLANVSEVEDESHTPVQHTRRTEAITNEAFQIISDLRSEIYRGDDNNAEEMLNLVRSLVRDNLLPRISKLGTKTPINRTSRPQAEQNFLAEAISPSIAAPGSLTAASSTQNGTPGSSTAVPGPSTGTPGPLTGTPGHSTDILLKRDFRDVLGGKKIISKKRKIFPKRIAINIDNSDSDFE